MEYISAKHVGVGNVNLKMCDVNSLHGIADCVGLCVIHVGLLKHSQPKLTEIFHRTFYMEVHNS